MSDHPTDSLVPGSPEYHRAYYLANRERILAQRKLHRAANASKIRARVKAYRSANADILKARRAENADKCREKNRAYYAANREQCKARAQRWREANASRVAAVGAEWRKNNGHTIRANYLATREKVHERHSRWQKAKRAADPNYAEYCRIMRRMCGAMRKHSQGSCVSNRLRIVQLLGCEWSEFISHIERQFQPGMTWENHGRSGWHFDHIRPLSSFDLTVEAELRKGCHYTNVQPLWAADNIRKGGRVA
jgi:hypothetical protein